jgi:hypothetical protein
MESQAPYGKKNASSDKIQIINHRLILKFPMNLDEAGELLAFTVKVFAEHLIKAAIDGDISPEKKSSFFYLEQFISPN